MMDERRHRELIRALLSCADPPERAMEAWVNDAEFHAQIETLARVWAMVLPSLLDASAARDERVRREMERLMNAPPLRGS